MRGGSFICPSKTLFTHILHNIWGVMFYLCPEGKLLIHFAQNGVKCKLGHSHLFLAKSNENVPKVKKPITTLSFPRHLICATICQFQQSFTHKKKEPKFSKLENMAQTESTLRKVESYLEAPHPFRFCANTWCLSYSCWLPSTFLVSMGRHPSKKTIFSWTHTFCFAVHGWWI